MACLIYCKVNEMKWKRMRCVVCSFRNFYLTMCTVILHVQIIANPYSNHNKVTTTKCNYMITITTVRMELTIRAIYKIRCILAITRITTECSINLPITFHCESQDDRRCWRKTDCHCYFRTPMLCEYFTKHTHRVGRVMYCYLM